MNKKILLIVIACFTFFLTGTSAFASLTLNSNSITSDGSFNLIAPLGQDITVTGNLKADSSGKIEATDFGGQIDVTRYGCVGDGTTNNDTCISDALAALAAANGGTLFFPPGVYRVNSQILIPNTAGSPSPTQKNIRITGAGGGQNWYANYAPSAATLDLRYTGAGGKIETLGRGTLVIDNITIKDGGSANSTPLLHTTNTSITIRDNVFSGSGTTNQDAIVLGGTVAAITSDTTGGFQGYGSVIDGNVFTKLNRGIYFRTWANSVAFTNNSFIEDTGTVAIESDGSVAPSNGNYGLRIEGNTIEMNSYVYGIKLNATRYSKFDSNSFWDPQGQVVNNYYLSGLSTGNTFIAGVGAIASIASYRDFGGDATSLALSNIFGFPNHTMDTTGSGEVSNELAGGLVVKGSYNSTNNYPGQLTVSDQFSTAGHLTLGYNSSNSTGILDAYLANVGAKSLLLNPSGGNVAIGTTSAPGAKLDIASDSFILRTSKTPVSASATCTTGMISWDANYTYVCVATNTWKRSALSTW